MGQFSRLDCVTGKQIIDDKEKDVYVLVPEEFRETYGKHIKETCYDGYGRYGGYDIYDLVALWNRDKLNPDNLPKELLESHAFKEPRLSDYAAYLYPAEEEKMRQEGKTEEEIKQAGKETQAKSYERGVAFYHHRVERLRDFLEETLSDEEMKDMYGDDYLREIGIDIACYDKENAALPYPIKVTYDRDAVYEDYGPSPSDPNQGWEMEEEYDDYEDDYDEYEDEGYEEDY